MVLSGFLHIMLFSPYSKQVKEDIRLLWKSDPKRTPNNLIISTIPLEPIYRNTDKADIVP